MPLSDTTQFKTQADHSVRVISLANLIAICQRVSGVAHVYEVPNHPSAHRATVVYTNPDEYGHDAPVIVSLPSYPNEFEPANPYVVLAVASAHGGRDKHDRDGAVDTVVNVVFNHEKLFRPTANSDDWRTAEEWNAPTPAEIDITGR